jgi:hypothetical protein
VFQVHLPEQITVTAIRCQLTRLSLALLGTLFAIIIILSRTVFLDGYETLERQQMESDLKRASEAITLRLQQLGKSSPAYSGRDKNSGGEGPPVRGSREGRLRNDGWQSMIAKRGGNEIGKILERIAPLHPTGSGNGQDSLGKALTFVRFGTKADLPPLDGMTQGPFGSIAGRFNASCRRKTNRQSQVLRNLFALVRTEPSSLTA